MFERQIVNEMKQKGLGKGEKGGMCGRGKERDRREMGRKNEKESGEEREREEKGGRERDFPSAGSLSI